MAHPGFARFLLARLAVSIAVQMQTVAVGWQIYAITHDPLDLGLIGLSQFLPFVLLVLPAGHVADRRNRARILTACYALEFLCALLLLAFTLAGLKVVWPVFAVMVLFGVARAFSMPAGQALLAEPRAAGAFQPRSRGQLERLAGVHDRRPRDRRPRLPAGPRRCLRQRRGAGRARRRSLMFGVRAPAPVPQSGPDSWHTLLEGLRFVWQRKIILGAVSLDLFAVLFGGATALLPAYAHDVLLVGPDGLGILRAAPGVGAALIAVAFAWRPLHRRVGPLMFAGVALFGIATVVFGLSASFTVSLLALTVLGGADMVSVYIRHLLVQLETPDAIRGRVSAVNAVFIGASNELGEFESGLTAAWWGLKPAVVVGGVASVAIAGLWMRWFPALRDMDRFPESPGRGAARTG